MSFDWKNYFNIAKCLKNNSPIDPSLEESRFRCAISRYYYSLLNLIKSELIVKINNDLSQYSKGKSSHRIIIELLYSSSSGNIRNMGADLVELKEMREDSDYRLQKYEKISGDFKSAAEYAHCKAESLLNDLNLINKPETVIDLSKLNVSL